MVVPLTAVRCDKSIYGCWYPLAAFGFIHAALRRMSTAALPKLWPPPSKLRFHAVKNSSWKCVDRFSTPMEPERLTYWRMIAMRVDIENCRCLR